VQKAEGGRFEHAVWIDVTSINIWWKRISISSNWTDQLLFTYKIALCNSYSQFRL